jgi:hypothetical protein
MLIRMASGIDQGGLGPADQRGRAQIQTRDHDGRRDGDGLRGYAVRKEVVQVAPERVQHEGDPDHPAEPECPRRQEPEARSERHPDVGVPRSARRGQRRDHREGQRREQHEHPGEQERHDRRRPGPLDGQPGQHEHAGADHRADRERHARQQADLARGTCHPSIMESRDARRDACSTGSATGAAASNRCV